MSKEMREQINKVKNWGQFLNENKWYLVKKGDEYYAEREVDLPHSGRTKRLFRDFNGQVMSLGKDKQWAEDWVKSKNEIDGYL